MQARRVTLNAAALTTVTVHWKWGLCVSAFRSAVSACKPTANEQTLEREPHGDASKACSASTSSEVSASGATKLKAAERHIPYTKLLCTADALDWLLMVVGSLGAAGNGIGWPIFSIIFGAFLDTGGYLGMGSPDFMANVTSIALKFVYLAAGSAVGGLPTGQRQAARIRRQYLAAVLHQDMAFFDTQASSGVLLQALNDDIAQVQVAISETTAWLIQHSCTVVSGFAVAFSAGWDMSLVMLGTMPFLGVIGVMLARAVATMSRHVLKAYAEAADISQQALSQIRTVTAYNGQQHALRRYADALDQPTKTSALQSFVAGLSLGTYNAIMCWTTAIGMLYGAWSIARGQHTGGTIQQVFTALLLGGISAGQVASMSVMLAKGRAAGSRVFRVIEQVPAICSNDLGTKALEEVQGGLELRSVSFVYPARPDTAVLTNINLMVPAGSAVALVGSSGSGKSTIVQLIARFYDPVEGCVMLDGADLRCLDVRWLREQLGFVTQEPTLFAGTIYDNIAMGRSGAAAEEVYAAAEAANAHKFICRLPFGYNTQVGERGLKLSGGQKQRITIARAIVKDPKVLLLDEATSSLDTRSELLVQTALDNASIGRTTVIVAHRLSTIRNVDQIAVIRHGRVIEKGCHDELMSYATGSYKCLVAAQMPSDSPPKLRHSIVMAEDQVHAGLLQQHQASAVNPVQPSDMSTQSAGAELSPAVKVSFSRLLRLNRSQWSYGLMGLLACCVTGPHQAAFALILSNYIILYYEPVEVIKDKAPFWAGMFCLIGVTILLGYATQMFCFGKMGAELTRRVRCMLFGSILYQEIAFFDQDQISSGALSSKLAADAAFVRGAVGDITALIAQNILALTAGFAVAFVYSWRIALIVAAALPLLLAGYVLYYHSMSRSSVSDTQAAAANQLASEAYASIKVVQAFNLQDMFCDMYIKLLREARQARVWVRVTDALLMGYSQFALFATYGLVVWYGGREVDQGHASFGDWLKSFFAIVLSCVGIAQTQMAFPDIGKAKGAIQATFRIIDRKPVIDASSPAGLKDECSLTGAIQLRNVHFFYPSRPASIILKDFTLDVPAGQFVALVGESGSGKSTVLGLILRYYDASLGSVCMDGVDVRCLNVTWLRAHIGLVSQDPLLFTGSILDNLKYSKSDASMDEVEAATRAANAYDFVMQLPQGFNTQVGEHGVQLSSGQKQRICIARAILKCPRILLLDEATSALDTVSERAVQDALDSVMVGRTSVVVSHRLSTIRHAGTIAYLHKGVVVEQGTHEELMAMPGRYSRLVAAHSADSAPRRRAVSVCAYST